VLKSKRMRNQKTLIAVVAFLLLFSSVANAGWWDDIKGCFEEPEKKDIGVNKVKEYCDSAKSKVKGATGSIKDDIDSANRATGNIDRALEDYNSICGGFCTTEQLAECNGMGEINCTGDLCCSFCTDDKLNACQNIGDSESCVADPCCSWGGDGGLCESVEIFALCVPDEPLSIGSIDDKLDEADAKIDDTLAGVDDKVNDMVSCSPEKLAECSGKDAQSCEGICCSLCTEEELDECFNEEDPESCNDDPCCTLDAEQCKSGAGAESCLPRKRSLIEELSDTYDDVKTKIDESPEAVGSVKKDFGEMCDVIADGCSSKQLAECSGRQEQECTGDICCSFCTEEKLNGCPDIEDSGLCVDDSCCSWNDVGGFCESVEIFALCVPDEPLSVDGAMGEIDAELTDLEVWLSGLPDEADEIINQNGGENSTYAKFKIMHNKLNSVYEKLAYIRGLYIEVGGVCGQAIDVVRGQIGCTAEQIAQANCSDKDTVGCIEELCCSFCTDDKLNACSDIGDSKLCIDDTCCSWGGDEQGCGSVVENASCVPVGQSGISKSLDKLREQCITVEETIQEEIMDPVETLIFGCTAEQIAQVNCGDKNGSECSQEPCCSFCTE